MTDVADANSLKQSPGSFLQALLARHGITAYRCARDCKIAPHLIGKLRDGKLAFTTRTAAILGHYFGIDPLEFIVLQAVHGLANAAPELQARLNEIRPLADTLPSQPAQGAHHD